MTEEELKKHFERFRTSGNRGRKFLLEVECPTNYTGLWLKDSLLGWALCETAFKSGVAKYIRLFEFPDANTKKVLFDSKNSLMVKQIEQSIERRISARRKAKQLA